MPLMFFLCELPVFCLLFRELLSVSLFMGTGGFLRKSVGLDRDSVGKHLCKYEAWSLDFQNPCTSRVGMVASHTHGPGR